MRTSLYVLLALLTLAVTGPHAVTLAFKDAAGVARNYQSDMTITGVSKTAIGNMPINGTVTMTSTEKVTGVNNGLANISYQITNGKINLTVAGLPGEEAEQVEQAIPQTTMTFSRTAQGKTSNVKMTGAGLQITGGPIDAFNSRLQTPGTGLEFPAKDLKEGDTWGGKVTMDVNGMKAEADAKYTLAGTETSGGKTYQKITCALTMTVPNMQVAAGDGTAIGGALALSVDMKMTGTSTMLFDTAAGEVYKTTMKSKITMVMAIPNLPEANSTTDLTMDGTTTRVK